MQRPDWLTPARTDAALFLASCFIAGAAFAVLGAILDRRLCRG